jgi:D-alanyl-D-alanine carboxypeptidase
MRKTTKFSLSSAIAAGVLGAVLLPAAPAFATEGFVCPEGTDTIDVTYGYTADNTPELAGTVCVLTGTTIFDSLDTADGWTADLRSTGSRGRTEVRFYNDSTGDRVELRYEPGRTEIK